MCLFDEFFFFELYLGEDIPELIITSIYIDPIIHELEERSRGGDDEVDHNDNAHESVESCLGCGEAHEENDRQERSNKKSDETTIDREEDITIIGKDLTDERCGEDIEEDMYRESGDNDIRLNRADIDIEREHEYEEENGDDGHLGEYNTTRLIFIREKSTIEYECQ